MTDKQILDFLVELGGLVAETFGDNCEVAISQDRVVQAIFNGHVSGRKVGSPIGFDAEERINNLADGTYVNYSKCETNEAMKNVKSSTICLELDGKLTSFCINFDCNDLTLIQKQLDQFLCMRGISPVKSNGGLSQLEEAFEEVVSDIGKPVHLLNKQDRLEVIRRINHKGYLDLQKSIVTVAKLLGVTRYTIYNYLKELEITKEA